MTNEQASHALTAYYLAIAEQLQKHNPEESVQDLARQYAKGMPVTRDNLADVAEWFNWDVILKQIEGRNWRE